MMHEVENYGGRFLIALLFVLAGVGKIIGPKPFLDHMGEKHVPKVLLPLVIAIELAGGAMILIGWQGYWAALVLAGFCLATAVVFHLDWTEKAERTLFFKDLAIAGGLLVLSGTFVAS